MAFELDPAAQRRGRLGRWAGTGVVSSGRTVVNETSVVCQSSIDAALDVTQIARLNLLHQPIQGCRCDQLLRRAAGPWQIQSGLLEQSSVEILECRRSF